MQAALTAIGLDADDTLWHNERFFKLTEARFAELLAAHADKDALLEQLLAAERRNVSRYGFGIKGFILSMIETAIEVTLPSGKSAMGPTSTHCHCSALSVSAAAKPTTGTRMAAVMTPPVTTATPVRNFVRVM